MSCSALRRSGSGPSRQLHGNPLSGAPGMLLCRFRSGLPPNECAWHACNVSFKCLFPRWPRPFRHAACCSTTSLHVPYLQLAEERWGVIPIRYRPVPCDYQPDRKANPIPKPTPGEQPPAGACNNSWASPAR